MELLRIQYFTSKDINVQIFVDGEDYFKDLYKSLVDAKEYMYLYLWLFIVPIYVTIFLFMTQLKLHSGLDVFSGDIP